MGSTQYAEEYAQLLRHPRWQRRRLEIMQSRGWACENCGDAETELHVHHTDYRSGHKPWEYPDDLLKCLCERCHRFIHGLADEPGRPEPRAEGWASLTDKPTSNAFTDWIAAMWARTR